MQSCIIFWIFLASAFVSVFTLTPVSHQVVDAISDTKFVFFGGFLGPFRKLGLTCTPSWITTMEQNQEDLVGSIIDEMNNTFNSMNTENVTHEDTNLDEILAETGIS